MTIVRIYDIEWDIDCDDSETDLPAEVIFAQEDSDIERSMNEDELREYGFADRLSDEYGFCVRTFSWEKI